MTNNATAFVPIYRKLAEDYKKAILELQYKPGDRLLSISEMQKQHSISRETAKLVLKLLAEDGLIIQKAGKGSFIADLVKPNKIWAIILPFYSVFYEEVLRHLQKEAKLAGCELHHFISHNSWQDEIRLVGQLISDHYEAIIVIPTLDESKTADFYRRLTSHNTIVVLMDHTMTGSFFSYVIQSYDLGVTRAMEYLLQKTSGSIGFVRSEVWAGRNMVQELMEETYKHIIEERRSSSLPLIIEHIDQIDLEFLQTKKITALFCCDDTSAMRVIGRLRQHGMSIPGAMNIVSYGNTDIAQYFTPAITSIDCHTVEMAKRTAEIITEKLSGIHSENLQYVIQPDLIIRET